MIVVGGIPDFIYQYDIVCFCISYTIFTRFLSQRQLQKACVAFMTHPLMVLSAAMVKNPAYQGHTA